MPEDAFEMNYVFTDGEGATDNNQGQNYLTSVESRMTPELWAELAMDRLVSCSLLCAGHPVLMYRCEACMKEHAGQPPDLWMVSDEQVAAEKKRKAEEAKAREAAERERREREDAEDRAAAQQRAFELRESVHYHRQGL
jgi:starch synthase